MGMGSTMHQMEPLNDQLQQLAVAPGPKVGIWVWPWWHWPQTHRLQGVNLKSDSSLLSSPLFQKDG